MKWAHANEEGYIDWTSDVEQAGLVKISLPLPEGNEKVRLVDGKPALVRINGGMAAEELAEKAFMERIDRAIEDAFYTAFSCLEIRENPDEGEIRDVAVLVPCCGKAAWVKETVSSALAQTRLPDAIKVLLMDADSRAMKEELEGLSPLVQCECAERMNVCAARNYLAEQCGTEFFAFLDADDILQEDFLEKALARAVDFVLAPFSNYSRGKRSEEILPALHGNLTGVYRKEAFLELGGLDESFSECGHEDTDFIIGILESGRSVRVESGTRYFIRREDPDSEWAKSSFVCSSAFQGARGESADALIKKHRNFFMRACPKDLLWRKRVSWRYFETGESEHLFFALAADAEFRQGLQKILLSPDAALSEKCFPGRDFEEAAEFAGDFGGWTFLNCEPSDGQKAFIARHCRGRKFDALFLCPPANGQRPSFADILAGTDKALVHDSVLEALKERKGKNFRAELFRSWRCSHLGVFGRENGRAEEIGAWDEAKDAISLLGEALPARLREFIDFDMQGYIEEHGEIWPQVVTFELHKECNRSCPYCTQSRGGPYPKYSDEEMYERFDKMLARIEKIARGEVLPQFMGGEPTLWSDELIGKILGRLGAYSTITVVTNHDIRTSAWEHDPRVKFYTHIVDWQGAGKIELGEREDAMIVVCHDDVPFVEDFVKANEGAGIRIDEYIGEDEAMRLTAEDRAEIARIESLYKGCDRQMLRELEREKDEGWHEKCRNGANIWRADCTAMTIVPCCGRNQPLYAYDEFAMQLPSLERCEGCNVFNRF